jgi:hypothetical protein
MTGVRFLLEEGFFVLPQQTGSLWSPPLSFCTASANRQSVESTLVFSCLLSKPAVCGVHPCLFVPPQQTGSLWIPPLSFCASSANRQSVESTLVFLCRLSKPAVCGGHPCLFVPPQQTGSLWSPPLSFSSNFIQILINLTFLSEDV